MVVEKVKAGRARSVGPAWYGEKAYQETLHIPVYRVAGVLGSRALPRDDLGSVSMPPRMEQLLNSHHPHQKHRIPCG
jgi:hypothetical protein